MWDTYEHKANFFWLNFGLLMFAALVMFAMLRWLKSNHEGKGLH